MATGRANKLTGQIAEHLVCAERGRRDVIATPFSGNVPKFDVIAADDHCRPLPIQVKATREPIGRRSKTVVEGSSLAHRGRPARRETRPCIAI